MSQARKLVELLAKQPEAYDDQFEMGGDGDQGEVLIEILERLEREGWVRIEVGDE